MASAVLQRIAALEAELKAQDAACVELTEHKKYTDAGFVMGL